MPRSGVGASPAYTTLVLKPAAGDLHLRIRHQKDVVVSGTYDSGENVPTRDVARRHRMFPRGAGWSSRPGVLEQGVEWDGYAESVNACLRFGYICPAGEMTTVTATTAWGTCNKIIAFNGDLFFLFVNRIVYLVNGLGAFVDLYNNAGDVFIDAEIWGAALRVAVQCSHAGVNIHFFVTITVGAPYTVINPTPAAPAGTAATVATPQCLLLETVFWEYQGVAAFRLVAKAGASQIKWMITPTGDPYDALNWGPAVSIGPTPEAIQAIVASHDTVWVLKPDGCYSVRDATALAGGENLTPYWRQEIVIGGGVGGYYWQDQLIVYRSNHLESIDVNSWQVQDRPRPISIEIGRPNTSSLNALRYTALTSDNQWILAGVTTVSGGAHVLYGINRRRESPTAGITEYDWFSEIGPVAASQINYLHTFTPTGGHPTLWITSQTPFVTGESLFKVDLFTGGSPIADPNHRYATTASVTFTDEHFAARSATKGALRGELDVRGCGSGRKVDFYAVAGAGASFPGSPNASVTTNVETSTFNLTSVRGSVIRTKAVLTSTATVPVVVDEVGLKANLGFPLRRRGTWLVELSDETEGDLPSFETPSTIEAALKALCQSVESFTVLDDEGTSMTVVLENVMPWQREDVATNDLGVKQKVRVVSVGWQEIT